MSNLMIGSLSYYFAHRVKLSFSSTAAVATPNLLRNCHRKSTSYYSLQNDRFVATANTPSTNVEDMSKAMHQQMEGLMGKDVTTSAIKSASSSKKLPSSSSRNRSQSFNDRYGQALINVGLSFFTVLLAAQAMKSSKEKRKAQHELITVRSMLESKRQILQNLQNEATLHEIADKCVDELRAIEQKSDAVSWSSKLGRLWNEDFGRQPDSEIEERLIAVLKSELNKTIGTAVLTDVEVVMSSLDSLNSLKMQDNELKPIEIETDSLSGATHIKRKLFSI